jgi:Streptomycin 6-kinase
VARQVGLLTPPLIPPRVRALADEPNGRTWLEALPRLVDECVERWQLQVGPAYPDSNVSLVLPATRADDSPVVVKIQFPHLESTHEAAALACWNGDGAVHLLDHDQERHALLVERCHPGTHLSEVDPDPALDVLIGLLPRLWKPVGQPFRTLAEEAAQWIEHLPMEWRTAGRPFEEDLVNTAVRMLDELSRSQGEQVLLHQDLHGETCCERSANRGSRSTRSRWSVSGNSVSRRSCGRRSSATAERPFATG